MEFFNKLKKLSKEEAKKYIGKEIFFWSEKNTNKSNIYKAKLLKIENQPFHFVIDNSKEYRNFRLTGVYYLKPFKEIEEKDSYSDNWRSVCFEFCGILQEKEQLEFNF